MATDYARYRRRQEAVDDGGPRIVLALDYGTTFTGVAYASTTGRDAAEAEIHVVQQWPGEENVKVPSRLSYSRTPQRKAQFGSDIDSDSVVLSQTKLELLEAKDRLKELNAFCDTLYGLACLELNDQRAIENDIPPHLSKNAEDVVEDYLDKVAAVVYEDMSQRLGSHVPRRIPIDMIITHPAKWDEKALNRTFRAVTRAFSKRRFKTLRDISFVSEPEACAHFTLQAAQKNNHDRFIEGDCFIVVDAGGGTVDLVSFRITEIDHANNKFKMEPFSRPTCFACGSIFVDRDFNDLLKERLDPVDYDKLTKAGDFGTGGHYIQKPEAALLHERFLPIKHGFTGADATLSQSIVLPRGMGATDRKDHGIENGTMFISSEDLRKIFSWSVDKTLALIWGQIQILTAQKQKPRNLFLSGGYAKSEYLFSKVSQYAGEFGINVERGDECWSAVARGAVLKGLGLLTSRPPVLTRCPRHFGIKTRTHFSASRNELEDKVVDQEGMRWAREQILWFVQKDDVILPGHDIVESYECYWRMSPAEYAAAKKRQRQAEQLEKQRQRQREASAATGERRPKDKAADREPSAKSGEGDSIRDIIIIASEEDEAPVRYADVSRARDTVCHLSCDLTRVPETHCETVQRKRLGKYIRFRVRIELTVSPRNAVFRVVSGKEVLAKAELPLAKESAASSAAAAAVPTFTR